MKTYKNIYRKINSLLLLLFVSLAVGSLSAQSIRLRVNNVTIIEKDTFQLVIQADSTFTGKDVYSYRFSLSYNSSHLKFIELDSVSSAVSDWGDPTINSREDGKLNIAGAGATPLQGSGEFIYLKFYALSSGNTSVSWDASASMLNEGSPSLLLNSGTVRSTAISMPSISPMSATHYVGETRQMSASGGTPPYTYASTNLNVGSVNSTGLFTAVGPGKTKITVTDSKGHTATTNDFSVRAVRFNVMNTPALPQDTIYLPLKIEVAPGTQVYSADIELTLASGLEGTSSLAQIADFPGTIENKTVGNKMIVSFASSSPITGSGILCRVGVKAVGIGNHTVSISKALFNENLDAYLTTGVVGVECLPTVAPTGLLPESGVSKQNTSMTFYWQPTLNAHSYQLFLWKNDENEPSSPYRSGISGTSTTISGLVPGASYNWKVVSLNSCSEESSITHTFTVKNFPDLEVTNVTIPTSVQSGGQFDVTFTVKNTGQEATGGNTWRDAVYISSSSAENGSKTQLRAQYNLKQLNPDESYTQTYTVTVPSEYEGTYYIFVRTDISNDIVELFENNNQTRAEDPLQVSLKPFPDIMVKNIRTNQTTLTPGEILEVMWDVANIGDADAIGGWTERVTLVAADGRRVQLSPTVQSNNDLEAGDEIARSHSFKIPDILKFSGNVVLEVRLTPQAGLVEYTGTNANNTDVSSESLETIDKLFFSIATQSISEASTVDVRSVVTRSGDVTSALQVHLSVSQADQLSLPATVEIAANTSSTTFYMNAIDNNIVDGTRNVFVTVSANNYLDATAEIEVLDNEATTLNAVIDKNVAYEGDTLYLTISRNLVSNVPLQVNLSTSRPSQWVFNNAATIPANEASVVVPVYVVDDAVPELTEDVTLKVSSGGFEAGEVTVTIIDDDVPDIDLVLSADTISEGAGTHAVTATLTRLTGEGSLRINLTASRPNTLILPSSITIPAKAKSIQFNIGVIDNSEVDGYRDVEITGSVYLTSCGCSSNSASGGIISRLLVIADNDGPSLTAVVNPLSMYEGKEDAGKLVITRNTETSQPLMVSISHDNPTELTLPTTAVIPAGAQSIEIPITTLDDGIEDGDQLVNISVNAIGFSSGYCYVYVTDSNKPDYAVSNVMLSRNAVEANDTITVSGYLKNIGYLNAPTGSKVALYLAEKNTLNENKDQLLGEFISSGQILMGDSVRFSVRVKLPQKTGAYYIIAHANPSAVIDELVYSNNTSEALPINLLPEYTATAHVDVSQVLQDTPVNIYGVAKRTNNTLVPNAAVDVFLLSNGTRKVLAAHTDETGAYSVDFSPLPGESGHYDVGASYPGLNENNTQANFDILGLKKLGKAYETWLVKLNEPLQGSIQIKNTSNIPLTNVRLSGNFTSQYPLDGCEITSESIPVIEGNETATLTYTVEGTVRSLAHDYYKLGVEVVTDEGLVEIIDAYYYCQLQEASIVTNPSSIVTTVTKNSTKYFEFTIFNQGAGESGLITVEMPNVSYLSLVSSDTISSLKTGEDARVTVKFTDNGLPLNAPANGTIAFRVANGNGITLPFKVEAVSTAKGVVEIDVVDEYTYNTTEAPHLKDAHVTLRHPFSGVTVAEGFTGNDGVFRTDSIPEGYYTLTVEAEKHEGYRNNIYVEPGKTLQETVFISFQAITYTWEVVRTEIEDEYEVDLILSFETNVPAPVVIMELPEVMPELVGTETFPFYVTLTNKGLITALDLELTFPDDPEYEFITNYRKMDLLALQSIQVPVVMRRKGGANGGAGIMRAMLNGGACTDFVVEVHNYECGKDKKWHQGRQMMKFEGRMCGSGSASIPSGGGGGGGGGGGPILGGSGGGGGATGSSPIVSTMSIVDCDNCLTDLALTVLGCVPGPIGLVAGGAGCAKTIASDGFGKGGVKCVAGNLPVIGCGISILDLILTCYSDPPLMPNFHENRKNMPQLVQQAGGTSAALKPKMPPIIKQAATDLIWVLVNEEAGREWIDEVTGIQGVTHRVNADDFMDAIDDFVALHLSITSGDADVIKQKMEGTDITQAEIDRFVQRWNNTLEARSYDVFEPNGAYPDIIDDSILDLSIFKADSAFNYAIQRGYRSVGEMGEVALNTMRDQVQTNRGNSVCASITIKISQRVAMTREAFEGTLTIENGNMEEAMKNIKLNLEIKNSQGILANDLFQINTKGLSIMTGIDGTGQLDAGKKGSASILFIPTKHAAPEVPESYSFGGTLSYLDPFTGLEVTKQLFPVTLDVNPSPDLHLHYFMQRDIYGDDPLTEKIEPIVPAELALMIHNEGYGPATKVRVESAQPEIIENQKGLAIELALIGSNLNGQERQLGVTNIEFGDIPPKSTAIGQWWFTSSLMGHFVHYETRVVHLSSYGNPNLSLINGATLHELIKSIRVYNSDDGINDFLVNEVQDNEEMPDAIYTSQGEVLDVYPVKAISFSGNLQSPLFEVNLNVEPRFLGWNYGRLADKGGGPLKVERVTRLSDNFVLPKENVWQTHVTMMDGNEPVYENNLHFIDDFQSTEVVTYKVEYSRVSSDVPTIVNIEGVPEKVSSVRLQDVTVVFEKPIEETSFTADALNLIHQGGPNLVDNNVTITKIDSVSYNLDLSQLTINDGYYVLTIETTGIENQFGDKGYYSAQAAWSQYAYTPAIIAFIGLPDAGESTSDVIDNALLHFTLPIDTLTLTADRLTWLRNGVEVALNVEIAAMDEELRLFNVSGMSGLMDEDGVYELLVDLENIKSINGVNGLVAQSAQWLYDTTSPQIKNVELLKSDGFDSQHVTEVMVVFNEPVDGFALSSVELWRDGNQEPTSQLNFTKVNDSTYMITDFRLLTYYEAEYELKLFLSEIADRAGNAGQGIYQKEWTVNRQLPVGVSDLRISPDKGYSSVDGITSTGDLEVSMTVHTADSRLKLYYNSQGDVELLADITSVPAGEFTVPVVIPISGSMKLQVETIDRFGNSVTDEIGVYIDKTPLTAGWSDIPQGVQRTNPEFVILSFSEKLLDDTSLKNKISCKLNDELLNVNNLEVAKLNDTQYRVSGFTKSGVMTGGIFTITIDASALSKYNSGMAGDRTYSASWTLRGNRQPVADAGENIVDVIPGFILELDGSGSYDEDMDVLSYYWTAPENVLLSSAIIKNPTFIVPDDGAENLTFQLIVSDGVSESEVSEVTVYTGKSTDLDPVWNHENKIAVYPNPSKGDFTILFNESSRTSSIIRIYDTSGKLVYLKDVETVAADGKLQVEGSGLHPGVYMLDVRDQQAKPIGLQKLIITR